MFIDHKKIFAAASASFCVRSPVASALLCCGLVSGGLGQAHAQDNQRRDPPAHQQGGPRGEPQRSGDGRPLDPRRYEERAEEQRRAMQEASRNAEMSRRVGRMTPDERRDLRRQINEVSQDLYALPPKR